jgi:hypothetical protein
VARIPGQGCVAQSVRSVLACSGAHQWQEEKKLILSLCISWL